MAIIEGPGSGQLAEVGGVAASAIHCVAKPQDYGAFGHYQWEGVTGTIGAGLGASSHVLQLRWTVSSSYALIHEVTVNYLRSVTAFAAGDITLNLAGVRAWTVDGTGGSVVSFASQANALRSSMGAAQLGLRMATTAALTAGTSTVDANSIAHRVMIANTTANAIQNTMTLAPATGMGIPISLFRADVASGEHPIVLGAFDGLVLRATVPATGTWIMSAKVKWSEVAAF